jgi:hypothetical protein
VVVRVVTIHLTLKEMVTLEDQVVVVVQDQVFIVDLVEQVILQVLHLLKEIVVEMEPIQEVVLLLVVEVVRVLLVEMQLHHQELLEMVVWV